ncbi:chemotaxis phosphatase chex [Lucifera butyrica]|uniref:Chemotaxis phosphatase chex n=1 Tax=Lucifera butyrica TaxID=1351585 RepID=A0A498QYX0_9FIRM|nr:chemotaxis protein CheX [Lucifera butyrica]VBB05396.1 chemotaxis phosphatase chex [Lucifera butyrica]
MDAKIVNPFLEAVSQVLPQLGFQNISRGKMGVQEQFVFSKGVTILIGMTNQVRGNIAYNMSESTAKKFASTMMMGMPVDGLNEMAQSAIAELVNMVTASAAISLEKQGLLVDISPPSLIIGENFKARLSNHRYLALEMLVDQELVELNIGLES